jgi:DNA-binding LytR/AlgR family response regulator
MRIAICDNDLSSAHKLKHILYNYCNTKNFEFLVEIFKNGEELLQSESYYSLIFIECSLKGLSGLETAKQIKKQNGNAKIIFISADINYIFNVFEINAYCFLTKPFCTDTIYKKLDELFFNQEIHYYLWVKDGYTTYCIDTAEIVYLEADNKYCYIHLNDGVIWCKKTMARVYEALPKLYFLKINRAFVVNINCINKYNTDSVFLKSGEDLHITRTYYKDFKKNYTVYSRPTII